MFVQHLILIRILLPGAFYYHRRISRDPRVRLLVSAFLCFLISLIVGCAAPHTIAIQPVPALAPHLYFYRTGEVLHEIHRQYPSVPSGYITRDSSHALLLFHPYYAEPPVVYQFNHGKITKTQPISSATAFLTPNLILPGGERAHGIDDAGEFIFTYSPTLHRIRLRDRPEPHAIRFEFSSMESPQSLFTFSDRLYLVTGPDPISELPIITPPGARPNPPRHLLLLRRNPAGIVQDSEFTIPATEVLDIDPWSDLILAEDRVWVGWSPLFYGQPVWQSKRFLYNLKTATRNDLPIADGIYELPVGFFLQSDPLYRESNVSSH